VREGLRNPFRIPNVTGLVWLPAGGTFPPAARAIIAAAGPRPLSLSGVVRPAVAAAAAAAVRPPSPAVVTSAAAPRQQRHVALFICCDTPPQAWPRYISTLATHRANLSEVILSLLELSANGSLVIQGSSAQYGAALSAAVQLRAPAIGLRTTALVACSPTGVHACPCTLRSCARALACAAY
jgi:hypothetical protein